MLARSAAGARQFGRHLRAALIARPNPLFGAPLALRARWPLSPFAQRAPESQVSRQTCMGLFLSRGFSPRGWAVDPLIVRLGLLTVLCSERERPFFVPSPAIRFPERAEGVKGTETLAQLGGLPP